MGLDQYINYENDDGIGEEIYLRKVNWLRNWVIANTELTHEDDCKPVYIPRYKIESLLKDCKTVLEHKEKAPELLPTVSGFFFGSTEYDEDYYSDVEYVSLKLEEILSNKTVEEVTYNDWW